MSGLYAADTSVSVERSKSELDALLVRYGATQRVMGADDTAGVAFVVFRMAERQIRLDVPLPKRATFTGAKAGRSKYGSRGKSADEMNAQAWEQACRARWRGVLLLVKAKLESVAIGLSTIEREFLADIYLPDGRTLHSVLREQLAESYLTGGMPPLLGPGPKT